MQKIFIDALSIATEHISGVGHNTLELIKEMDKLSSNYNNEINLVLPLGKKHNLDKYNLSKKIKIKTIPLPGRLIEILLRLHLMPPVDLFIGKGSYIFPNYKNWPLYKSKSYTFILDVSFMKYPEYVQPKNLNYLKKYINTWIGRTDKIITISNFSKSEIINYFKVSKSLIEVVYCGVNHEEYIPLKTKEIEKFKSKHKIDFKYILCLGNIEPRKNILRLIQAYNKLPYNLQKEYKLLIVGGDGWLNSDINNAIADSNRVYDRIVRLTGYVDDNEIPALICGSELLAYPTLYEGFGLTPLQAMSCGIPVLTSNTTSIPEVVGNSALKINPMSIDDISEGLKELITNKILRKKLITSGKIQSLNFSWNKSAEKLLKIVNGVSL